jgi:hypothetical protein
VTALAATARPATKRVLAIAVVVAAIRVLDPAARADQVVTGAPRPARVEFVMVGPGPARAEMERAVRDLVGGAADVTWSDGGLEPSDEVSQVLVDVTDRARIRIRIVARRAHDAQQRAAPVPAPVVREVVIADLPPDVARETVAQIVQTTVRALLSPATEREGRALALEPPPIQPLASEMARGAAVEIDAPSPKPPRKARWVPASEARARVDGVVGAIVSVSRDAFPFESYQNLSRFPSLSGIVLSVGQRHSFLTTSVRLSGEWGTAMAGADVLDAQVMMASGGVAAHLELGPLSFALGAEVGAIVAHQQATAAILLGGFNSNWWGGPLLAIRASVDVRLFEGMFLRAEAGSPAVWVEPKHDDAATVWHYHRYTQVMLAAGYSF